MNYLLLSAGILILLLTVIDLAYTTFSPQGAGFFANTLTKVSYNLSRSLYTHIRSQSLYEHIGILTIVLILAFWYLLIWIGSSLIFCADPYSIVNGNTKLPADVYEKIYYTGFTLSTLGIGDYTPGSDSWRIFTVFLSLSGFVLITMGITYMVPVLSAVVSIRNTGTYIAMLGSSPQDILLMQWQPRQANFSMLETHFSTLTQEIIQLSQQMLAYPVVYCFNTMNPKKASALNIAKLDELLNILLFCIPPENRPADQVIYPLREAIADYLVVQKNYFIKLREVEPHLPDLSRLKEAGIPLLPNKALIEQRFKEAANRRKLMGAILQNQGRDFGDIYHEKTDYDLSLN